jgi:uncharacterized membrane protein YbaN (DUF454 family)
MVLFIVLFLRFPRFETMVVSIRGAEATVQQYYDQRAGPNNACVERVKSGMY